MYPVSRLGLPAALVAATFLFLAGGATMAQTPEPNAPRPTARPLAADPLDAVSRREIVEKLVQALEADYAYADKGAKMAAAVRKKLASGAYDKITSRDEFAMTLQTDVRAIVDDRHLRIDAGGPGMGKMPSPAAMAAQNAAIPRVEILDGNVGYIQLDGVMPLSTAKAVIDAAFVFLRNTKAIIIDARGNGGGTPDTVAYLMSYLSEGASYAVNRIQFRGDEKISETRTTDLGAQAYGAKKPVYYLISKRTFSGGEEFAYDLQAFKRGVIVGETSGGGANPGKPQQLGHGFSVFLPDGYGIHPITGGNWEGVGVKPDVATPSGLAVIEAHRLAVEQLAASAADPAERALLEATALSLKAQAAAKGLDNVRIAETHAPAGELGPMRGAAAKSLDSARIVGVYVPVGEPGPARWIEEKGGVLTMRSSGPQPPTLLIPLGGSRFALDGLPENFTASFFENGEKVQFLLSLGERQMLMEKP
jgi:hypothetical protein